MLTEVDELHTVGQMTAHQHLGGARNHGLPAVGGGHQPGTPIDRQAGIPGVVDDDRLVGVQSDPRPQWPCGAPWLCRERLLERRGRGERVPGGRERGRHAVTHPREDVTAMGGDRLLEDLVVADHGSLHRTGSCSHRRVEPSRSVRRNVTVPEGGCPVMAPQPR